MKTEPDETRSSGFSMLKQNLLTISPSVGTLFLFLI